VEQVEEVAVEEVSEVVEEEEGISDNLTKDHQLLLYHSQLSYIDVRISSLSSVLT